MAAYHRRRCRRLSPEAVGRCDELRAAPNEGLGGKKVHGGQEASMSG